MPLIAVFGETRLGSVMFAALLAASAGAMVGCGSESSSPKELQAPEGPSTSSASSSPKPPASSEPSPGASGGPTAAPVVSHWSEEGAGELRPSMSVAVNGGAVVELFRGWPLLIQVQVLHPQARGDAAPIVIAAKEGAWSNAVQVQVKDGRGETQTWPMHLATSAGSSLSLDSRRGGGLSWWVAPEETAPIPEGTYQVVATLDTTASPAAEAWKGKATSAAAWVRIANEPASLGADQQAAKLQSLAHYHLLRGDSREAQALVDGLLQGQPGHLGGLMLKADLLAEEGKLEEAVGAYDRALEAFQTKYPAADEPPAGLLAKRNAALEKLLVGK